MERGRAIGFNQGKTEGIAEGFNQGKLETAALLLNMGSDLNFIQKATLLSIEQIEKLKADIAQANTTT